MNKILPKKKPYKIHFEDNRYKITADKLSYIIKVSITKEVIEKGKKIQQKILPETFYSDLDRGLEYAKETAEFMIAKYS